MCSLMLHGYCTVQVAYPSPGHVMLLKWLCLCLGNLCQDATEAGAAPVLVLPLARVSTGQSPLWAERITKPAKE